MRDEVDQFLAAVRTGGDERRSYERFHPDGLRADINHAGGAAAGVAVQDISRGGARLGLSATLAVGSGPHVRFVAGQQEIDGRVVRCDGGIVGVVFRQDPASLAAVDAVIAGLKRLAA